MPPRPPKTPPTPPTLPAEAIGSLEDEVAAVGHALARALERVIEAIPGDVGGPQRLAEVLGLDKAVASRLLKAIRSRDPVVVVHHIPGPDTLRRVIDSAVDAGVGRRIAREAEAAVDRFRALIRSTAGDRSTLDGVVSRMLPQAREHFDGRVKQQIFRGFSQLKGYYVDVDFTACFIHPSPHPGSLDYAVVSGVLGVRSLRPDVRIRLAARVIRDKPGQWHFASLLGEPITDLSAGRLDQFCTARPANVAIETFGDSVYFNLESQAFGPDAAVDFVLGHASRLATPSTQATGAAKLDAASPSTAPLAGAGVEVDKPTKLLHLDVFVHKDVYPGAEPRLFTIDTSFRGLANLNDPSRIPDRVDLGDRVQLLGRGLVDEGARAPHIQHYQAMLDHVVRTRGWNPHDYRAYRVLIAHPIYGTQVTLGFERLVRNDL